MTNCKYGYVTVLYGDNVYITGAVVLGFSLMKTESRYDRIVLVTPDVTKHSIEILSQVYTKIVPIDYVKVNPNIFLDEKTRFRDVFTKLRCLDLIQYEKIIILDLDMIITKNIDHLFNLNAPAACLKKNYVPYGKRINPDTICSDNKLVGSINAGLMLLVPDREEWLDIQNDILTNNSLLKYRYPEQDYISLRYCNQWTSITFNYNFQFGLTDRVKKCKYTHDNIYVIHYSSSFKPWNRLIKNYVPTSQELKFIKQHKNYYKLWEKGYDAIKGKFAQKGIDIGY